MESLKLDLIKALRFEKENFYKNNPEKIPAIMVKIKGK